MTGFDLVIRGGRVATASDTFDADIGVRGGKIAAIGEALDAGREEIDARGKWVLPGGIDSHCHIAQLSSSGVMTADDFKSGSTSAGQSSPQALSQAILSCITAPTASRVARVKRKSSTG